MELWHRDRDPLPWATAEGSQDKDYGPATNVLQERWERTVVCGDVHVPFQDERAVRLFLDFCKYFKPDVVILNGDILDMWEVSHFDKDPRVGKTLKEEIEAGREFLKEVRQVNPTAKIVYIFGNHEFRLQRYLINNAPALIELDGLTLEEQLHCADLDIKVVSSGLKESDYQYGGLYVGHYDRVSKHSGFTAKALVEDKNVNIIQSHTHRVGSYFKTTRDGKVYTGMETGCLCQLNPTYVQHPNWQHGFIVVRKKENSDRFQAYPVVIVDYEFFWGDKHFKN